MLSCLSKRVTTNKTKHLLVENELEKLKAFDFGYFIDKSHFEEDGTKNYLVFQSCINILKCFLLHNMLNLFQNGNLKDYLMKVLRRFLRLIIVLI